jgi:small subunit ribosomal protein S1
MVGKSAAAMEHENFAALLEESFATVKNFEGTVVKGIIVAVRNDYAVVDVGLKSEGRVSIKDLTMRGQAESPKVGDTVDVFVERLEDRNGEAVLSIEKARREAAWIELEKAHENETMVNGVMFGRVKGGFAVDLAGVIAFLPGSQVDIRPIKDVTALMNIVQPFKLLKMDKARSNIVVSRRAVLEESRAEQRTELVAQLTEGQVVNGIVKNITDYGAFIDLGGVDGLLHVTDISWRRINHPSDVLKMGDAIDVQVIRFNKDSQRISLGMKQLENDPWKDVEGKFEIGSRQKGRVSNIADYGAFVELGDGVEGLIYVTEMSWTKKNIHPSKILTVGDEVEVVVLEVDMSKRRISLGLKQTTDNPWKSFQEQHPVGSVLEGMIKNITEFGLFVGVQDDLDGMVHMTDISWDESGEKAISHYSKNQMVQVKVLDIDFDKERISLGIKQLTTDAVGASMAKVNKNEVVTVTVSEIDDKGISVTTVDGVHGYIKKLDLSRDRALQRTDKFAVGEKIDAKVIMVEKSSRKLVLSIKALEMDEEKKALSEYGSTDSGASLGDILGDVMSKAKAIKEAQIDATSEAPAKKKTTKKEKTEE